MANEPIGQQGGVVQCAALFFKGPNWDESLPLERQPGFAGHGELMQRLAQKGQVVDSGPFHESTTLIAGVEVGLAIFASGEPTEVEHLLADDPVVAAGSMRYRLHPWYLRRPQL